jgi:hypothetical protein
MTDKAEQIAAGLTEAQRSALVRAGDPNPFRDGTMPRIKAYGHWRTTNALFDLGLTDDAEMLTPLGLAVRTILERQSNDHQTNQ